MQPNKVFKLTLLVKAYFSLFGLLPSIAYNSIYPFLSIYLVKTLSYKISEAGFILGSSMFVNALLQIVSGRITDRVDRVLISRIGLTLICIFPAVLLYNNAKIIFFLAYLLSSFGYALLTSTITNLIYNKFPEPASSEVFSYYYAAYNCGNLVSPIFVFFSGYDNLKLIFRVSLIIHIIVVLLCWRILPTDGNKDKIADVKDPSKFSVSHQLLLLLGVGFSYSLVYSQYFTNFSIIFNKILVQGREIYPLLISLNGALVMVFQFLYIQVTRKAKQDQILFMGGMCVFSSFLLLQLWHTTVITAFLFGTLFTLGEAFINPSVTSLIYKVAPENNKASWLGIYNSLRCSGGLGIIGAGWVLDTWGVQEFLLTITLASFPLVVFSSLFWFSKKDAIDPVH